MAKVRRQLFSPGAIEHCIGRYRVLEPIGNGGMGMVYAAYDDKLDRKIAVKILRDDQLPTEELRLRFLREAQALARLSHPNVVTVHEVGDNEHQMFLAMEFVRGQNLGAWLTQRQPTSSVIEVFAQAGRGLMAAHNAGLVHRDFKPANVMRGHDGVVKVLDFGLARPLDLMVSEVTTGSIEQTDLSALTVSGEVVGTPAYMSPEQHQGGEIDERSDQYSFCLALWEGLVGQRPFAQRDYDSLVRAKRLGPPSWPSAVAPVPRRVVEALRRGLASNPDDRWPSMQPLLEALHNEPRRNRWLMRSVGAGVVGLGAGLLVLQTSANVGPEPCSSVGEQLAGIWDSPRRAEVEVAILGIDKAYATGVWARTKQALDDYASDWTAMRTDVCEAVAATPEPSPSMLDLMAVRCLQQASNALRATVDVLANADDGVVQRAHELTADLPALSRCADAEALSADVEPPPASEAAAVDEVRRELARSRSLVRGGRYPEALAAVDAASEHLEDVEYGPIHTDYAFHRGEALRYVGDVDAAETALEEALELGTRYGQRQVTVNTLTTLMLLVGSRDRRMDEALRYRPLAVGLTEDAPLDRAKVQHMVATVLHERGDYPEAEIEYRSAIAKMQHELGADAPAVATMRVHLGFTLLAMGSKKDAEMEQRAGLASIEAALGPAHPNVAQARIMLGSTLADRNKLEEAVSEYRQALTIYESALGPHHRRTVGARCNLAVIFKKHGDLRQAEAELRVVLPLMEQAYGAEHLRVAALRNNYAGVLMGQGRLEEAESQLRSSLEISVGSLPPEHLQVLFGRINLSDNLMRQHRYEEAEAELRPAIATLERSHPPEHPALGAARSVLARLLVSSERFEEARPTAEAAWERQQRDDVLADDQAAAAFALARVLWNVKAPHRDRSRARWLAELAADRLEANGDPVDPEIRRWLESRPVD
ncbi:MAG: tetratricopeptide repeat protein [Myxococcota bacterium]